MKYQLKDFNRNISDAELLDDLKKVAVNLKKNALSSREYNEYGKFTSGTIGVRFGSWNRALKKANLEATLQHNISEEDLFNNIEKVWIKLGRQPVFRDMKRPFSDYSSGPYRNKFGTFRKALEAFVDYINSENTTDTEFEKTEDNGSIPTKENELVYKHKTKRTPSERLKVQVLMRDGNKCRLCGVTITGDDIHFDHILAWSKGGETVLENLQILCAKHNLAKGNL